MGVMRLSDFRGQWLLLFSHPADFTPVCTSEFVAFARAADRFTALGCRLMAISVDSLYAHLAWVRAIRDGFGVSIGFPIVEDPSLVIGRAFGMISASSVDAAAMRATYFIDPAGVIRATISYPATVGRSIEEMLRVLAALQKVDAEQVVTPEGWRPGTEVLLPPETDGGALLAQDADPLWFHRTRPDKG